MNAKAQREQDQPRGSPPAMLMNVPPPNSAPHRHPSNLANSKPPRPGRWGLDLDKCLRDTKSHTSGLHPRQAGSPTLNRPAVKFIRFQDFIIDKIPFLQKPPRQYEANWLLLIHILGFSVVAFALKTNKKREKSYVIFNADLKEKKISWVCTHHKF